MADLKTVQIHYATLEYRANYEHMLLDRWDSIGSLKQATFEAFKPWNITLEQVSDNIFATNLGQAGVLYQVLGRYNFKIGIASITLSAWNPTWNDGDLIAKIAEAGTTAFREAAAVGFKSHEVILDLHFSPPSGSAPNFTRSWVSPTLLEAAGDNFKGGGFIFHTLSGSRYLDISAQFPDSLYARIVLSRPGTDSIQSILAALYQEEVDFFKIMGLHLSAEGT